MLVTLPLLALALAAAQQAPPTRASTPDLPLIAVTARLNPTGDGAPVVAGLAGSTHVEGFIWSRADCKLEAGSEMPKTVPAFGWRVSARVTSAFPGQVQAEIEWQRMWTHSKVLQGNPTQTVATFARPQHQLELDRIAAPATCADSLSLGLFASQPTSDLPGGTRSSGGRGGPPPSAAAMPARGGGRGSGSGPPTPAARLNSTGRTEQMFGAEVWLVHTNADGTVQQTQVLTFNAAGTGFGFAPVPLISSQGTANVIVMGALSVRMEGGTPAALVVTITRLTTGTDASAAGSGDSTKEIPWSAAVGKVVSFELPQRKTSGADSLAGHQFSLRVRVGFFIR